MAMTEYAGGSLTLSTTGLMNIVSGEAETGVLQVLLDLSNFASDTVVDILVTEAITSAATPVVLFKATVTGPVAAANQGFVSPSIIVMHNWSVMLQRQAGSSVAVPYSLRFIPGA
jgi:hypothetical protein